MNEPNENLIADAVVDAVRKHLPYGAVDNVYWGAMWQEIRREARSHLSADLTALREENAKLREATAQARREALEEAAKLCHDYSIQAVITSFQWHTARQLEAAIRALAAQEPEAVK